MPEGDEVAVSPDRGEPFEEGTGRDLSRILSLSDGIFGFALTLMVLTLVVPMIPVGPGQPGFPSDVSGWLAAHLQQEVGAFEWYVLGFLLIAIWWMGHHTLFARMVRWTRTLIGINLAFLLTIAVSPFFLELLERFDGTETAVAAYAASQLVTSGVFGLMTFYAMRTPGILDPRVPEKTKRLEEEITLERAAVFGAAFVIALFAPSYALFVLLATLIVQVRRRRGSRPRAPPAGGAPTAEPGPAGAPGAGAPLRPS